jgi:hypothetical protein
MRKYIFNSGVISAVVGGWTTLQTTRRGPRDWRLILMWVTWILSLIIAIGTVITESHDQADS